MKTIQSLVLAAIVLGTSACASNAVKQAPAAGLSDAPSTSATLAASAVEAPPAAVAITPLSADTNASTGTAADAIASPVAASTQTTQTSANAPEAMTQAEQEAEALYATPAVRDPWEGFNRKMHSFNNVLDRFVLRPVAVGYDKITPDPVQSGVSRFFSNLRLPATAINQALQGRPGDAGQSLGRFVVNSTAGIGGVFDPAKHIGMPKPDGEDLGQTLATWGWRDSRYLVMPIMGPRTVRDALGGLGDQQLSVINQIDSSSVADKLQIMQMVDVRAQLLPTDQMRRDAIDDYTFVRDAWAQRRNRQIEQDLRGNRVD
ncbi:VacJ family lipoprotein [Corticibacter populi]|uniref:VacJ family lipoprotein n=1 Tax=Corticibacter populi TaxID=1550736 RepID=A0A3M6QUQ1_9BURK|nr:VacJ family lipoprotein [Corticibacter populi]RMX06750.1 VacJ family lipoprotein [Corticibacter populi]RZS31666.1 phospholipid-binding lipoprotein MlaA [Corticibacter populi]